MNILWFQKNFHTPTTEGTGDPWGWGGGGGGGGLKSPKILGNV